MTVSKLWDCKSPTRTRTVELQWILLLVHKFLPQVAVGVFNADVC